MASGRVVVVAKDGEHRFSKEAAAEVRVIAGLGVEGDAHRGITVKHRSRVAADPSQPNLRQVHLIILNCLRIFVAKASRFSPLTLAKTSRLRELIF